MPLATNAPTLLSVIQLCVDKKLRNTGVALPGIVKSYADGKATVQPGVTRAVPITDSDDFAFEQLPVIHDVPVCWPQGRNFKLDGQLVAGDPVLLVCLDTDPSAWLRSGTVSDPDDVREHSWANAVAIPGLVPDTASFQPDFRFDAPALASKLDQFLRAVAVLPDATNPATAVTAIQAVIVAARLLTGSSGPGNPGTETTGSAAIKLSE